MRGFAAIGLHQPKTPENVGAVLRAASVYGVALVAATGKRYRKAVTDTTCGYRHLPLLRVEHVLDVLPYDCVPVCVELVEGARSLVDYVHPVSAFYVFGPEDGSVPSEVRKRCRDTIFIPGSYCSNLAATVNVVLYDRMAKAGRSKR